MLHTTASYADSAYFRAGFDGGKANNDAGLMVEFSAGAFATKSFALGFTMEFAPHLGYRFNEKEANGDRAYLNYFTFGPQMHYVVMPSWPVNLSFLIDGGIGGLGSTKNSDDNSEGQLNDLIFSVKGRASLNFLISDGFGFYIGGTYCKVYRSQNRYYTNKELSGYEISFGVTGIWSDNPAE
jgi:hypothetical protein